jgi:GT2 family glycosyltransferase/glycosyltransferase involved in cell wall biosynthesis
MTKREPVSVVVPVYDGLEDVRACLASVLGHAASTSTPARLVVVDDASPDPAVAAHLDELAGADAAWPVLVVRNPENLGFVRSVNRGMEQAAGDVVLLNSDTIVTDGWLDRLADAAALPDVATVTPLTGSGSLCTVPASVVDAFDLDGDEPRVDECGRFVAAHSLALRPEVISGVGFCMYVTREALDRCGSFDADTYGRGYGEEVDFCLRASRLGLRHLVEDSTFVHHREGGSFGDERDERMVEASKVVHRRFRWFRAANRYERRNDPLAVPFAVLEQALHPRDGRRPHVLHVLHGPLDDIGGTEKHLRSLLDALEDRYDASLLYPVESGFVVEARWSVDGTVVRDRHLLPGAVRWVSDTYDEVAAEALRTTLDLFDVGAVHIHSFNGHSLAPLQVLADFDGPVTCSVHDQYLGCPHFSLLYRDEQACGLPDDLSSCGRCLPETEQRELRFLEEQRSTASAHLDTVDHWVLPSRSAADHLLRVYDVPADRIEVIPHGTTVEPAPRPPLDLARILDEPLRLAMVGRGWPKKGIHVVNQLADELIGTPVEVHHYGALLVEASPALHVHGPYDNAVLGDLLHLAGIQIVLLPGAVPESFGLVMSEVLLAGLPVIGARFGALGERLRASGAGWTIDPDDPTTVLDLVRHLDAARWEVARATEQARAVTFETVAATAPRYAALYGAGTTEPEDNL